MAHPGLPDMEGSCEYIE